MLFEIDPVAKRASEIERAGLAGLGYFERYDVREWVLSNPKLLNEELLVITDEFSKFDRTGERLDVLALDTEGKLVVVELKRSAVGSHADLQAIRYAAYCSMLTLSDIADIHADFVVRREGAITSEEALEKIVDFLGDPEFKELDNKPRIILCAEEFPPEITACALRLRDCDIDIRCIRLVPHHIGGHLVVDASVLIPLPEAEEFIIRREQKEVWTARAMKPTVNPEDVIELYGRVIQALEEEPAFTKKAPPKSCPLYFRNFGDRSLLGAIAKTGALRVELYIDEGDREFNRLLLESLAEERERIESEVGTELVWDSEGKSRKCAILV